MPMTREQIQTKAMNLNQETPDTPGYKSAAFIYSNLIDEGADKLSELGLLYCNVQSDLVNSQSFYPQPSQLYRSDQVVAMWQDGVTTRALAQVTPFDMDVMYPSWRTQPATGFPSTAIFEGMQLVGLYPQPDYTIGSGGIITPTITGGAVTFTVTAGGTGYGLPTAQVVDPLNEGSGATCNLGVTNGVITSASGLPGTGYSASTVVVIHPGGLFLQGYAAPSRAGFGGSNIWPLPSSVCPLTQPNADNAIAYYAAMVRCTQHPTADNKFRLPIWESQFKEFSKDLWKVVINANRAIRTADSQDAGSTGWYGGSGY